jgi:Uma2 family endonuclease
MAVQTKMTADEFLQLPESQTLTELIDGDVIVAPAPELGYQDSVLASASFIKVLAQAGKVYIAPVDVHFDDGNVVQPDVMWLSPDSACFPAEGKRLIGAPDLIVEVLSPSTALRDKGVKFRLYEQYGVREYWLIDPAARYVEVWWRDGEKFALQGVFGEAETFASVVLGEKVVEVLSLMGG